MQPVFIMFTRKSNERFTLEDLKYFPSFCTLVQFLPICFWFNDLPELWRETCFWCKFQIIDEVILEIEGKSITYVPGKLDDALFGGNASAEGGMEETEEETITGCNIVLAHRLSETGFDKKGFTVYIKEFMKVNILDGTHE